MTRSGKAFLHQSKPEQQEEVDQEREQGEQGAADEGRDSEVCGRDLVCFMI